MKEKLENSSSLSFFASLDTHYILRGGIILERGKIETPMCTMLRLLVFVNFEYMIFNDLINKTMQESFQLL